MSTSSERVIKEVLGRMADEAPRPLDVEELGNPVVVQSTAGIRGQARRRLASIAAVAFVGVLAVAALLISRANVGVVPVGSPTASSAEEFATVIVDAFDRLRAADGVEGVESAYTDGQLEFHNWFTTRPNGDAALISRWRDGDRQIQTAAGVSVGGDIYEATRTTPWTEGYGDQLAFNSPVQPLVGDADVLDHIPLQSDAEVIRQDTSDGGTLWTVNDGALTQTFHIHPDGYLDSWAFEFTQPPAHDVYQTRLFDRASILYAPLTEPEPIPRPTIGSPLSDEFLDLPDRFHETPSFENP